MQLGTTIPTYCTGEHLVPADVIRNWSERADEAGFDGLWALDHLVKPDLYRTSMLDPLTSLSHAAAVTDTIGLGTSILILPLQRTANVVSRATSLHHLSSGRLTLGLGGGYVPEEFAVTGVPMAERGPRLSEGIEVMQALFEGETDFDGRFHSFDNVQIDPVQDDPPRILAGGGSTETEEGERQMPEPMLDRILEVGGWIAAPSNPDKLEAEWNIIAEHARDRGVNPDSIDTVVLNYTHVVTDDSNAEQEQRRAFSDLFSSKRGFEHAQEHCLTGTVDEINRRLDAYEELGFDQVIAGPATSDPDRLRTQLPLLAGTLLASYA